MRVMDHHIVLQEPATWQMLAKIGTCAVPSNKLCYGLSPSHPDPMSIGVLAHPTRTGPSQQREGHTARNLHHFAEMTDQLAQISFFVTIPYYNYYYYLLFLHGIVSYYSATLCTCMLNTPACFPACTSPLPHVTCHHLLSTLYLYSSACVCELLLMKASVGSRNI